MNKRIVMLSLLMALGSIVGIVSEAQAHVHGDSAFRNPSGGAPGRNEWILTGIQDEDTISESAFPSDPLRSTALIAVTIVVLGAVVFLFKRDKMNKGDRRAVEDARASSTNNLSSASSETQGNSDVNRPGCSSLRIRDNYRGNGAHRL